MIFPERDIENKVVSKLYPFADKQTDVGKLYRRKHGFRSGTIPNGQSGTIDLIVPYDMCKINLIELMNCKEDITIDFKIYDTPTGTISTVPNYMLNQFGFGCELPDGLYIDKSEYDADLIKDMKLEITVTNNTGADYILKGNITYHEVKV
jgi:hypothetical protein